MHAPRLQLCCVAASVTLVACADSGAVAGPGTPPSVTAARNVESAVPTSFDVPGSSRTLALDINEKGEIVGRYVSVGQNHGFLRDANGTLTTVDYPGASFSVASGVNDRGAIVGGYTDTSGHTHGLLLERHGTAR